MKPSPDSVADVIARQLKAHGITRVFALCGGHIMPIWMRLDAHGISIVDVRDERAAVHMAQAHAELTGQLGVALVTAGPGVTNAMTGIANAHVSRAPILIIAGANPRPQENWGGLQDLDHTHLVRSITRYARTVREASLAPAELDEAISRALGEGGEPGPSFIDFPADTLRSLVPKPLQLEEYFQPKSRTVTLPDPAQVARATELLWSARRVLVISGRGARGAGPELVALLDRLGAVYLDTGESRGLVPDSHPSVVGAMRGAVMGDADVVLTVGRRLDFQLAYGSPAIFGAAQFVRIADIAAELRDNRRGAAEILASPKEALRALVEAAGNRPSSVDREWAAKLRSGHQDRARKLRQSMASAASDSQGEDASKSGARRTAGGDGAGCRRHHGWRRFPELRTDWPVVTDDARPWTVRLHRDRRTLWHLGEPGFPGPAGDCRDGRRGVRVQRNRDRYRRPAQGAGFDRGGEQRSLADRGL